MTVDISKGVVSPHEAFCRILADWKHPCVLVSPDLGKQIVSRHWWRENAGRLESTVASAARAFFLTNVKDGKIGARGFSDNSSPGFSYASTTRVDIGPEDLQIGDLDLFDAKLKCPTGNGGARIYSNVFLSVADLEKVIGGRFPAKPEEARTAAYGNRSPKPRPLNEKTAAGFVERYLKTTVFPNITNCEQSAIADGYTGARNLIRKHYREQNSQREIPVKQGRKKLPKNSAKK